MLGSAGVTEVDMDYDNSVAKLAEVDYQEERIATQEVQESAQRVVSPESSKRPVVTSYTTHPKRTADFTPSNHQDRESG